MAFNISFNSYKNALDIISQPYQIPSDLSNDGYIGVVYNISGDNPPFSVNSTNTLDDRSIWNQTSSGPTIEYYIYRNSINRNSKFTDTLIFNRPKRKVMIPAIFGNIIAGDVTAHASTRFSAAITKLIAPPMDCP